MIPIIIAKVGDDPQRVDLWKRINIARLARGEMLMNIDKSLAWLEAGRVPEGAKVNVETNKRRNDGRPHQRQQVVYTDEMRAAARDRAKAQLAARKQRMEINGG